MIKLILNKLLRRYKIALNMASLDRNCFPFFLESPAKERIKSHCPELTDAQMSEVTFTIIANKLDEMQRMIDVLRDSPTVRILP